MYRDRIRLNTLWGKVMSSEEAAMLIKDGMTIGMSGFTRSHWRSAPPPSR